ncbi:MAG: glycosyltransferase [Candidatus Hodarchaeota archaeon]
MEPLVSVLVPTYNRALLLQRVLEGLKKQTYNNFEVIVVYKPSSDNTYYILKQFQKDLNIKIIRQKRGSVTNAYNLGLDVVEGEIVAFLDDDAVPLTNWLEEYVKIYTKDTNIGGISGPANSAIISNDGKVLPISEHSVYPYNRQIAYFDFPWARPLKGMSDYLIYFGKDGLVHHHPKFFRARIKGLYPSLLHMGANMSVRTEAIKGLKINDQLILGFCFEQLFSYEIMCRGYQTLFNSKAEVLHVVHKESLGRFFFSPTRSILRDIEVILPFFFLRKYAKVSIVAYVLEVIKLVISRMYRGREYGFNVSMYRIYGLLLGVVIGFASLVSEIFKGDFSIRNAITRARGTYGNGK